MYITLKEKIECSACGSTDYERFADTRYQGLRCKSCGHEKKDLHPHLKETATGSTFTHSSSAVTKF
jgi:ribosomal protein L37AE/L43A